jgi:LuxR family transcriptional regulator, maltose regulon positive regulatory protein
VSQSHSHTRKTERAAVPLRDAASRDGVPCSFGLRPLQSRLRPPQPLLELVQRARLVDRLSSAPAPLVVLAAPGGFGKTVTLSQWIQSDSVPCAWLQADDADNDPLAFLSYLVAALGGIVGLDPMITNWMQLAPPPVANRILPALAEGVAAATPFILVIDDAHLITDQACWRMIAVLLDHLPAGAQLCVSGRTSPPLPLARLRAAGRLCEIGPTELAFDPAEIGELLRLQGVAADGETVACLERATDGWAAGLYLAALAGARTPTDDWLAGIRGHQRDIADYLASEVLEQQSPEATRFLLQTSILERLSPGLCRAVTGDRAAGDLLRAVARRNLFVSALDDIDEWFRYHHLFAEFLQAELARGDEVETAALHGRAAAWFEAHDELEEAVRHWLAAGEPGRAGEIVCRAHLSYSRCFTYETTRRWLDLFTDEQILADDALTVAAGWIGSMAGDSPRHRTWQQAALRLEVGDEMWPSAPVSLRAIQAGLVAALSPEGMTQLRESAQLAVSLGDNAHPTFKAVVVLYLGAALWLADDDADAALPILREAEDLGATANVLAQNAAASFQAFILADRGRWDEARELTNAALARVEEAGLTWGPPTFPTLLAKARLQARDGDPALTESIAAIALVSDGNTAAFFVLLGDVLVGEMLAERGDLEGATHWMRAGFTHLSAMPDAGILRPRLLRLREQLERLRLLEPLTAAERRVLELLPTELGLKQIAAKLCVSHETVRSHARDIYRKLQVHSRAEAVAKARECALLETS